MSDFKQNSVRCSFTRISIYESPMIHIDKKQMIYSLVHYTIIVSHRELKYSFGGASRVNNQNKLALSTICATSIDYACIKPGGKRRNKKHVGKFISYKDAGKYKFLCKKCQPRAF